MWRRGHSPWICRLSEGRVCFLRTLKIKKNYSNIKSNLKEKGTKLAWIWELRTKFWLILEMKYLSVESDFPRI